MVEQSLPETKFTNEYQQLRFNLLHTANWLNNEIRKILRPYGVTQKQYNILNILQQEHPNTVAIQDVRGRMIDKMSDASRMIDRLIEKGWVEKRCCTEDKRSNRVSISTAGLKLLDKMQGVSVQMDEIFQLTNPQQAAEINDLLNQLRK